MRNGPTPLYFVLPGALEAAGPQIRGPISKKNKVVRHRSKKRRGPRGPLHQATQKKPRASAVTEATQRRYPSTLGIDFRKLGPEALRTYVNRYRLDAAPDAPDSELAKVVAKHFEAKEKKHPVSKKLRARNRWQVGALPS